MNDNNLNNNDNNVGTYRATSNLNTAIENPQINLNSATGINMRDNGYGNDGLNSNYNQGVVSDGGYIQNGQINQGNQINQKVQNNQFNQSVENNNYINNGNNQGANLMGTGSDNYQSYSNQGPVNYTYEPVMKEKKRANDSALSGLIHSKEFKVMVLIVFVLVLFVLVMPYIYDFFRQLNM